jgi:hypothetical protein
MNRKVYVYVIVLGVFFLTLGCGGGGSGSSSTTRAVDPNNDPPVARFSASPESGDAPLTVSFDATESVDLDGTIESYIWDFGDGTAGAGVTTDHIYADVGNFLVELTVIDNKDAEDYSYDRIKVGDPGTPPNITEHELLIVDIECWDDYEDKDIAKFLCIDVADFNIVFDDENILIWMYGNDPDIDVVSVTIEEYLKNSTGDYVLYRGPTYMEVYPNYWEIGGEPYGDFDFYFIPSTNYRPRGNWHIVTEVEDAKGNIATYLVSFEVIEIEPPEDVPPGLKTMSFSPTDIFVGASDAKLNIRLLISDNEELSIRTDDVVAEVWNLSPSGKEEVKATITANDFDEGGSMEAAYIGSVVFPEGSETGIWSVKQVKIRDAAGNVNDYFDYPVERPLNVR